MSVLVGSARIDENGKISGGQAGDQTGNEVCTQEWYSKPWDFMAIHPDANVRELHAQAVEQACENDNVGYDQNQRNTLNTQAALVDYIIKNIKTPCECDCSSLQNVAAIASGAEKASNYGSNGWTTSTMKSALKALGYIIITDSTYLTSASYCVRGAIYVKAGSHTVGGLTNGSNYKKTLEKAGISTGTTGTTTGGTGTTGTTGTGTTGTTGSGNEMDSAKYGPDDSVAGTYTVTASSGLNVRYGIGKDVIVAIPKGTEIRNYGYYNKDGDVKWLYVQFVYNGREYVGYACSTYLQKKSSSGSGSGSGSGSSLPSYTVGNTYTVQVDHLAVRSSPEVKPDNKYAKSQLTDNGKANAHSDGCLKQNTKVTCKATKTSNGDVWMQIPSGWVAAYYNGSKYIK